MEHKQGVYKKQKNFLARVNKKQNVESDILASSGGQWKYLKC
jgi:hypothetical protein